MMKRSQFLESFIQFKEGLKKLYWKENPDWYLQFKRFDDEEFKQVKGYYGLYFISNYGQLVSFRKKFPKLRKPRLESGFLSISFKLHHGSRTFYIHNLVYETFVRPIKSKRRVIHKNGVNTDNYYKNLRAVMPPPHLRKIIPLRKNAAVLQFDKDGRYLKQYSSIEAAAAAGISIETLQSCLRKKSKTSGGYQWRYKDDKAFRKWITDIEPVKYLYTAITRPVLQFDLKGNFIWEYPSLKEAAKDLGYTQSHLHSAIARKNITDKEFQWRFKDDPLFENGIVNIKPVEFLRRPWGKAVLQFDLQGKFIEEFPNMAAAARELDIPLSMISLCANGKYKIAGDFQWKLKNDPLFAKGMVNIAPTNYKPRKRSNRYKGVLQFTMKGKFIRKYNTTAEAALAVGISSGAIRQCLQGKIKTSGGFQWRIVNSKTESGKEVLDIEPVKHKPSSRERAVLQFDLNGNFIREYRSAAEAERKTNSIKAAIRVCASGKYKTAGGFQWRFRDDPLFKDGIVNIAPLPPWFYTRTKAVLQFDLEGNFVKEYPSINAALREIGKKKTPIGHCASGKRKTAAGFQWKYKNDPRFANGIVKIEPVTYSNFIKTEPVLQFNLQGKFIKKYDSALQAAGELNGFVYRIRFCCREKNRSYKDSLFRYQKDMQQPGNKEEKNPSIEPFKGRIYRKYPPIFQFSREGKFIAKYSSAREASEKPGINAMSIRCCLAGKAKTAGGFQWRPSDDPLFKNGITSIPPVR